MDYKKINQNYSIFEMIVFFLIFLAGKAGKKNKNLKMKVVDDKLKIIDDVPTSAVEMAVKEKVCIIFQK